MRRQRNFIGPQGMGMVSLWGASSLIQSVQAFTITLSAALSGTATISTVSLGDSILFYDNYDTDWPGSVGNTSFESRVTFTNTTTITANSIGAATVGITTIIRGRVVTFAPGVIRSIQRGSLSFSGQSNTATITEVNTAKSFLVDNGFSTAASDERLQASWAITNATTLTVQTRLGGVSKDTNYQCVEYF